MITAYRVIVRNKKLIPGHFLVWNGFKADARFYGLRDSSLDFRFMNLFFSQSSVARSFFFWTSFLFLFCSRAESGFSKTVHSETSRDGISRLSLEELMDIEVTTVSRRKSTVGQSPAAVFVITPEMIRRSGATVIPELFRMVPGMSVARIDNNKWAVSSRGFNNKFVRKLLVQIDGRVVYNPMFSGVYWDTVDYPLEDIERIEVVRGPGASVWGANAVDGIINIITKPAQKTHGGLVSAGGGTEEQGFGTARYGGQIGKNLAYRVYGKGFHRDEQFALGADPHDRWWGTNGGTRFDWRASERDDVTFDGGYGRSVAGRNVTVPTATAPFALLNLEDETSNGGHILTRWNRALNQDSNLTLQTYWDHVDRTGSNGYQNLRWDTFDVDVQHELPLGSRQEIVYGAGYRYIDALLGKTSADNGFMLSSPSDSRHSNLVTAFVQDRITLVRDKLHLTVGSKFERNDFTGFEFQPTGRLLWTPTSWQSVWAAVSRAVRTPDFGNDGLSFTLPPDAGTPGVFTSVRGNTGLASEEVLAFELGYRAQPVERFSGNLALFYNKYDNLNTVGVGTIEVDANGLVFVPVAFGNSMHGRSYGAELDARWEMFDWWRLNGTYTFTKINLHPNAGAFLADAANEKATPQHQIYLQSSWDLPHELEFDLIGRFVPFLQGFNAGGTAGFTDTIDAYVSLDARVGWRPIQKLDFSLVGQNLLDSHHPEFGSEVAVRAPLVEIQRSVYAKATYQW